MPRFRLADLKVVTNPICSITLTWICLVQYPSTIPSRAPVPLQLPSKPMAAVRMLQRATSRWLLYPSARQVRQGLVDHKPSLNTGNDPGRAVFIGPTGAGRPQALQILTSIPRRPHLRGPIENTLQPQNCPAF